MKHYGHFLPWAGRSVKCMADDLERLYLRRENILSKLRQLREEIDTRRQNLKNTSEMNGLKRR